MRQLFVRPDLCFCTARSAAFSVERLTLETDRPEADGIRILFATDFHLRKRQDADAIASQLAEIDCDLRLYGGDFADRREDSLRLLRALSKVKAPLGVFAVPGNNDSEAFGDDWATMEAALDAPMLVNRSVQVGPLTVGGVDEYYHGKPSDEGLFGGEGFSVLLSHYPILPKHCRPNLMLSGHTHGGQFNCLGLTPYSIGFEQLGKKRRLAPARIAGLAEMGETSLLVSKGLGMSRIPLRVCVRREVHLITLKYKKAP